MRQHKKAFTLIELLVVISIIGLLASIALVSLNGARIKARVAAVQQTLGGVLPGVITCFNGGGTILSAGPVGASICSDQGASDAKWPPFPPTGGWQYSATNFNGNPTTFHLEITGDGKTCILTEQGVSGCAV